MKTPMTFTTRNRGAELLVILLAAALPAWAGSLDAPAAPAAGSGMPSTADIYNRLDTGATVSVPGAFQEPAAGPTAGTGRTLADIAAKLPVPDNTQGAAAGDVANGKTFWGLRTDGTWGPRTGSAAAATPASGNATAADVLTGKTFSNSSANGVAGSMADNGAVNITPGTTAQTIPAGYHNGAGSVAGDANLVSGNIKSGTTVFGVSGSPTVVDTAVATTAQATANYIHKGKQAYVNGVLVTGTNCPYGWSGTRCDIISMPFPGLIIANGMADGSAMPKDWQIPWNCVHDTTTGLTWEVKVNDSHSLHDSDREHTWYSSSAPTPGTPDNTSCIPTQSPWWHSCDTEKFVAAVNAEQLCGYSDWRLPSLSELTDMQTGSGYFFSDHLRNTEATMQYWSNETDTADPTKAITKDLYKTSAPQLSPKSTGHQAILVRP